MFSSFLDFVMQYALPVSAGVGLTLIIQAAFSVGARRRERDYQIDIVKSRTKILELEAKNKDLKNSLKAREGVFIKDRLFLN